MEPVTDVVHEVEKEARRKAGWWWWNTFNLSGSAWVMIAGVLIPILLGLAMYFEPEVFYDAFSRALVATGLVSESQVGSVSTSLDPAQTVDGVPVLTVTPDPTVPTDQQSQTGTSGGGGITTQNVNYVQYSGTLGSNDPSYVSDQHYSAGTPSGGSTPSPTVSESSSSPQQQVGGGTQSTTIFGFGGLTSFTGGGGGMGGSSSSVLSSITIDVDVIAPTLKMYVEQTSGNEPCTVSHSDAVPTNEGGTGAGQCTGEPSKNQYKLIWSAGSDATRVTISVSGSPTIDTSDRAGLFLLDKHNMITPVTVTVYDAAGNSAYATYTLRTTVDVTPPTLTAYADEKNGEMCTVSSTDAVSSVQGGTGNGSCVSLASSSPFLLAWKQGSDTTRTMVSVNGAPVVITNDTSLEVPMPDPATSVPVVVSVYDEFNNVSSVTYTFTTIPDTVPPTLSVYVAQDGTVPCSVSRTVGTSTQEGGTGTGACTGAPLEQPYVLTWAAGSDAVKTMISVDGEVAQEVHTTTHNFTMSDYSMSMPVVVSVTDAYNNTTSVSYTIKTIDDVVPPTLRAYVKQTGTKPCVVSHADAIPVSEGGTGIGQCTGQPSVTVPYVLAWDVGADATEVSVAVHGGTAQVTTDASRSFTMPDGNVSIPVVIHAKDKAGNMSSVTYTLNTATDTTPPDMRVDVAESPGETICPFGHYDGVPVREGGTGKGACAGIPTQPQSDPYMLTWHVSSDTKRVSIYADDSLVSVITNDPIDNNTYPVYVSEQGMERKIKIVASDAVNGGNETEVVYSINVFNSWPLVISEVGWGGTQVDPQAVWVEIHNPSNVDVPLGTFTLRVGDAEGESLLLSQTIPSHGYVLVENTEHLAFDPQTVRATTIVAPISQIVSTTPKTLQILHGDELIDTTPTPGASWAGGTSGESFGARVPPLSMERSVLVPTQDGSDASHWGSNLGLNEILRVGHDTAGNQIAGTPGVQNSLVYTLWTNEPPAGGTITLTAGHGVYYIPTHSHNTFANNVVVNAEPGATIVMAPGATLTIADGDLNLIGIGLDAITVTSVDDALSSGELDGTAVTLPDVRPVGWDTWGAIVANPNGKVKIQGSHISNGGKDVYAMIEVMGGAVTIVPESAPSCDRPETLADAKTSLMHSYSGGIYATSGELEAKCIYIGDYTTYGIVTNPTITPAHMDGNVMVRADNPLGNAYLENVMFVGSSERGSLAAGVIGSRFSDKTWIGINATGNSMNGIYLGLPSKNIPSVSVYAESLGVDEQNIPKTDIDDNDAIQLFANNIPYILDGTQLSIGSSQDASMHARAKLIVESDVVFKFLGASARVDVYGSLVTHGKADSPVFFTSLYDGLQTTNAKFKTISAVGDPHGEDWGGIIAYPNAIGSGDTDAGLLSFAGTSVTYAGHAHDASVHIPLGVRGGILAFTNASVTLTNNSVISDNGLYGIYMNEPRLADFSNVAFVNHVTGDQAAAVYFESTRTPDTPTTIKNLVTTVEDPDTHVVSVRASNLICKNNGVGNPNPNRDFVFSLSHNPDPFSLQDTAAPLADASFHYCDVSGIVANSGDGGSGGNQGGTPPIITFDKFWQGDWAEVLLPSDPDIPDDQEIFAVQDTEADGVPNMRVHVVTPGATPDDPSIPATGSVSLSWDVPAFIKKRFGIDDTGNLVVVETTTSDTLTLPLDTSGYGYFLMIPPNPLGIATVTATYGSTTTSRSLKSPDFVQN